MIDIDMSAEDEPDGSARPSGRRWRPLAAGFVLLLLVALVSGLLWSASREPESDGVILVDAPEIYTRERLVNDRFMQRSWLLELLNTRPDLSAVQKRFSSAREIEIGLGLGDQALPNPPGDSADDGKAAATGPNAAANGGVNLSAIDHFRLELAYRTEVRQSLLETMLDDGHDLDGNTLYMLKFDVAVIPPTESDQVALVVVELRRPDYLEDAAVACSDACLGSVRGDGNGGNGDAAADAEGQRNEALSASAIGREPGEAAGGAAAPGDDAVSTPPAGCSAEIATTCERHVHREIYARWVERIRQTSSDAFVGRYRRFLLMEGEETELRALLRDVTDDFEERGLGPPSRNAAIVEQLGWLRDFLNLYNNLNNTYADVRQVRSACASGRGLPSQPGGARKDFGFYAAPLPRGDAIGSEGLTMADMVPKLRYLMLDLADRQAAVEPDGLVGSSFRNWQSYAWSLDPAEPRYRAWAQRARWLISNWPRYRECPAGSGPIDPGATPDYRGFETAFSRCCEASSEGAGDVDAFVMDESMNFYGPAKKAWSAERFLLQQRIGEQTGAELSRSLGDFLQFDVVCNTYPHLCRLTVNEVGCVDGGSPPDNCTPPAPFRDLLRRGHTWTYAATPKEQADAVLSSMRTRSALQLLSSLAVQQAPGVEAAAQVLARDQQGAEAAGRRVHVMGFSDVAARRDQVDGQNTEPARFGWFIRPRERDGERQALQQSLNAIVSVPGWWRGAALSVRTCWRSPDRVPPEEATLGRVCWNAPVETYTARLPWSVSELRRTLGYEIRRYPFVESVNGAGPNDPKGADYFVDQTDATLLIEGGELWRSTTVTLGAQRASEIAVLPNMRGIVARFDRIRWPSQLERRSKEPGCKVEVPIRVWTSEGSTESSPWTKATIWLRPEEYLAGRCLGPGPRPAAQPPSSARPSGPPPGRLPARPSAPAAGDAEREQAGSADPGADIDSAPGAGPGTADVAGSGGADAAGYDQN